MPQGLVSTKSSARARLGQAAPPAMWRVPPPPRSDRTPPCRSTWVAINTASCQQAPSQQSEGFGRVGVKERVAGWEINSFTRAEDSGGGKVPESSGLRSLRCSSARPGAERCSVCLQIQILVQICGKPQILSTQKIAQEMAPEIIILAIG